MRGYRKRAALKISSVATKVNLPPEKPSAAMVCTTAGTPANFRTELIMTASPGRKINTFPIVRAARVSVSLRSIEVLLTGAVVRFRLRLTTDEGILDLFQAASPKTGGYRNL